MRVKLLSPTLGQQLTVRDPSYNFMEVHSACLLAQELNCPAFVGEFRFEIPEQLRSKVIRPDNLKEVMDSVMDKKLLGFNGVRPREIPIKIIKQN